MASITKLTPEDVNKILNEHYRLPEAEVSPAAGGMANSSYFCQFESRPKLILTVMDYFVRRNQLNQAEAVGDLMIVVNQNGVLAPNPCLTTEGRSVAFVEHQGSVVPIMVKEFIEGECFDYLPEELLSDVGRNMARLHKIAPSELLRKSLRQRGARIPKENFENRHQFEDQEFAGWLSSIHQECSRVFETAESPDRLIHFDIFADNLVRTKSGDIAILDWELGTVDLRLLDVAMAIVGVARERDSVTYSPDRQRLLMDGYASEIGDNDLTRSEKQSLHMAVKYCALRIAFWRYELNNRSGLTHDQRYVQMVKFVDSLTSTPDLLR